MDRRAFLAALPACLGLAPASASDPARPAPPWVRFPLVSVRMPGRSHLADLLNHSARTDPDPDRITVAHEVSHYIHADIRNRFGRGFASAGLYVGEDRAVCLGQPRMRLSDIGPMVPPSCRASRFGTYLASTDWDDSPLYVLDEWVAYANGARVGVELHERGEYRGPGRDALAGMVELSIYAAAATAAIERKDPGYFAREPGYLAFVTWHLAACQALHARGRDLAAFRWPGQEALIQRLRTSPDAKALRSVLGRRHAGAWLSPA